MPVDIDETERCPKCGADGETAVRNAKRVEKNGVSVQFIDVGWRCTNEKCGWQWGFEMPEKPP